MKRTSENQTNSCKICHNLLSEDAADIPFQLPKIRRSRPTRLNLPAVGEIQPGQVCSLVCGHLFHKICVVKSIEYGSHTCPTCQRPAMRRNMMDVVLPVLDEEEGAGDNRVCSQFETLKSDNVRLRGESLKLKQDLEKKTRKVEKLTTSSLPKIRQQGNLLEQKEVELKERLLQLQQREHPSQAQAPCLWKQNDL